MKNDYSGPGIKISIPPTILISVIGKIDDVTKSVSMDIKKPGDLIYILGTTRRELGASEYFASYGIIGSSVPKVDAQQAMERYKKLHKAITLGLISAAHDVSDGGLAVSLAEMAFAGGYGLEIDLDRVSTDGTMNDTDILYSETPSRIIIAVSKQDARQIEEIFGDDVCCIGSSIPEMRLTVNGQEKKPVISCDINVLKKAWKEPLDL